MKIFIITLLVCIQFTCFAQLKAEKQVANTVTNFTKAMVDANLASLGKIVDNRLSYGHSGGHVEGKEEFLKKLESGQSDFVTMDISNQTIIIHKKTAIVRHHIDCKTNDNNRPGNVSLDVLTVWKKKAGQWLLIARQAVHPK